MACLLAACSRGPVEPVPVFPDMADPTTFTRAFSLTESPDGTIRLFAQEDGDATHLYESVRGGDGNWGAPQRVDLPHMSTLSGPAFDPVTSDLYYVSDQPLELHKNRTERNIWTARRSGDAWVDPEPLPPEINTGATETSPALDGQGRLYFVTNHSRSGGGGLDIMQAERDPETGAWQVAKMPDGINSRRTEDHLAVTRDGQRLFFYSHREPKLGQVDIWMTERGDDGVWQAPVNIGAPVNSPNIDFGAGLSGDGKTFFFSRDGRLMELPLKALNLGE